MKLKNICCPGEIVKPNNRVISCNALLLKVGPCERGEIVCRRCKKKIIFSVSENLIGETVVKIRLIIDEDDDLRL